MLYLICHKVLVFVHVYCDQRHFSGQWRHQLQSNFFHKFQYCQWRWHVFGLNPYRLWHNMSLLFINDVILNFAKTEIILEIGLQLVNVSTSPFLNNGTTLAILYNHGKFPSATEPHFWVYSHHTALHLFSSQNCVPAIFIAFTTAFTRSGSMEVITSTIIRLMSK